MIDPDEFKLPPPEPDEREGIRPRASDLLRKVLVSGVGALFMTEEGIRSMVKELKLPKEVIGAIVAQADRTKGDIVRVVSSELRSFLESAKVREDLMKMLTQLSFEVRAEVSIKPRGEGGKLFEPDVRSKVQVKRKAPAKKRKKAGGP